jgi:hypothetical protein
VASTGQAMHKTMDSGELTVIKYIMKAKKNKLKKKGLSWELILHQTWQEQHCKDKNFNFKFSKTR